jgi:hypothetical protein
LAVFPTAAVATVCRNDRLRPAFDGVKTTCMIADGLFGFLLSSWPSVVSINDQRMVPAFNVFSP